MTERFVSLLLAALLLCCAMPALAEGGDGTGGGKGEALKVEKTSVAEGGTLAPTDAITLEFGKNVVNAKVREKNASLISLADAAGNPVEIDVVMADDQIEPDKKRIIEVVPKSPLPAGVYTLTVKSGVTAKNGTETAEDFVLTFTVAAPSDTETESVSAGPASDTETETVSIGPVSDTETESVSAGPASDTETEPLPAAPAEPADGLVPEKAPDGELPLMPPSASEKKAAIGPLGIALCVCGVAAIAVAAIVLLRKKRA